MDICIYVCTYNVYICVGVLYIVYVNMNVYIFLHVFIVLRFAFAQRFLPMIVTFSHLCVRKTAIIAYCVHVRRMRFASQQQACMFLWKKDLQFRSFIFPARSDVFVEISVGPTHPKHSENSESGARSCEGLGGGERSGSAAETKVAKRVAEPREGAREDKSGK